MKSIPLRYAASSIQTGPFGSQLHAEDYAQGGRPVVNPAHIQGDRIVPDPDCAVDEDTFSRLSQHALEPGDVVLGRRGELGRSAVVSPEQAGWLCGTGSIRIRTNAEKLDPRWLQCVLNSEAARDWLSLESVGSTMENLGAGIVGSLPVPLPSVDRQHAVLEALGRSKSQVELVVAAKQRVIDLLAEKRKAIIATAVMRGLDPEVKLRDSGVRWLGENPAHWDIVPLRHLVSFLSGGTPDKGSPEFWVGGTIPWVSPKDMKVEVIDEAEDHITEEAVDGSATRVVPVGSVLVVVRGMILAHTLPVALTSGPVAISQDIKALVCGDRLLPEFLRLVLAGQSRLLLSLADSSAHGTKKIETEVLQRLEVPVPPSPEQWAIVDHITRETARLDAIRAATQRTIALLKERRSALIAAAVTGQLDVAAAA